MKKLLKVILILTVILAIANSTFAATKSEVTMEEVENNKADMSFGKYGTFEKKQTNIDLNKKVINMQLVAKNDKEKEVLKDTAGEVVFLIDSSGSMDKWNVTVDGVSMTRKEAVMKSAKTLAEKLFAGNKDIKLGIAEYATYSETKDTAHNKCGTDLDANVVTPLTNKKEEVLAGIEKLRTGKNANFGNRTDLNAGLDLTVGDSTTGAKSMFSTDTTSKKYIILLTDGIPNTSIGSYYDESSKTGYAYYTKAQQKATKDKLLDTYKTKGITVLSCLIDMITDSNANLATLGMSNSSETDAEWLAKTKQQYGKEIFGDETSPNYGRVYSIEGNDGKGLTNTIVNSIYNELIPTVEKSYDLSDIVIKDYFPDNIVNNFDFKLDSVTLQDKDGKTISAASRGYSMTGDYNKDKFITWTIPTLNPGETGLVNYTLTLKDSVDDAILNTNLPTNKNVTINFKEDGVPSTPVNSDKCPIVKLTNKRTIKVTKAWNDNNNKEGIRPNLVTVQLYANGVKSGNEVKITSKENWTYSYTNLDRFDAKGKEITYTVKETNIATGYTDTIIGDMNSGFTITNKHTPTVAPTIIPKTGANATLGIAIITTIGMAVFAIYRYNANKPR